MSGELQRILEDLAAAQQALRQSSTAFDEAIAGLGAVLGAIKAANHAQGAVLDAVIAATNEALALFNGRERH
jgi:hypothetical protein